MLDSYRNRIRLVTSPVIKATLTDRAARKTDRSTSALFFATQMCPSKLCWMASDFGAMRP